MKQYALLGTYGHGTRKNIEILATSDDYHELRKIWTIITLSIGSLKAKTEPFKSQSNTPHR